MKTSELDGAHFDVLIVGAGSFGLAAAVHLKFRCAEKRWLIVEARNSLGGAWDQFRYPGVRSDSNMHSFAFSFRPWRGRQRSVSGKAILNYLQQSASENQLHKRIVLGLCVPSANWSCENDRWSLDLEIGESADNRRLPAVAGFYTWRRAIFDTRRVTLRRLKGFPRFEAPWCILKMCRLIRDMDKHEFQDIRPMPEKGAQSTEPLFDLSSGYVKRSFGQFPCPGARAQWRFSTNHLLDRLSLRFGSLAARQLLYVSEKTTQGAIVVSRNQASRNA